MIAHTGFQTAIKANSTSRGMPSLRYVPETIAPAKDTIENIEKEIDEHVLDGVIDRLTKPLTDEESSPKRPVLQKEANRIVFQGDIGEVNRFFYRRGWTDGLPVIPPTEEAVADMLTGTDLSPDYIVGELEPMRGKATVEKIAINAVMAGCLPTYMPVLIAAVRASLDPIAHGNGWAVSAGSWAPIWIINGPLTGQINLNNGTGMLSPGDIANAAIGRAMSLMIKNFRGTRKNLEDMGSFGNPAKYSLKAKTSAA